MDTKPIHVLLIEDNPGDARLICEMLAEVEGAPFALEYAERLADGLARVSAGGIDVVLLDLSLPDSQGADTFARMHAHAPGAPIVVMTGHEDEALGVQLVQGGAQEYLVKGQVSSLLLTRSIRYAIERQRAEEALRKKDEHHRNVVESIFRFVPEGLLVFTENLNLVKQNKAFEEITQQYAARLGYTEQELSDLIAEQARSRLLSGDAARTEIHIPKKRC